MVEDSPGSILFVCLEGEGCIVKGEGGGRRERSEREQVVREDEGDC